ncbi:MAG: SDR family NAD(P)-dependent oxidoreductase [Brevibacterium sp.]|nr:SDR family NAD(P)-dependent oxidoreductase [Brevibacterium sp.]
MTSHNTSTAPDFTPFIQHTLADRVALVAGATRGAGRAIARDLARAGAYVYCTGRSTSSRPSDYGRDEIIDGTAELIRAEGSQAEALVCDHLQPGMIADAVGRIDDRWARLDILVNDIGEKPMSTGARNSGRRISTPECAWCVPVCLPT